jgi:hypothetical protein
MKKFLAIPLSIIVFALLCSWTVSADTTLTNEQYNQTLFLYPNGSIVIRTTDTEASRGTGTYKLDGGKIYIDWSNGATQQGTYVYEYSQVKSVSIENVTYSRRIVRSR